MTTPAFGKYTILEEIGHGGFATVFRAHDTILKRDVALKLLSPFLMRDVAWVQRFYEEARLIARLEHPGIVTIYDIDTINDRLFLTMRLVRGGSLSQRLRHDGPPAWPGVVALAEQIADALDYAHGAGVLHRDLKPANILLDERGRAVLTDFGLARLISSNTYSSLASSDIIAGTYQYMAPEIWRNQPGGVTADIYAFGCILYEMVTGEVRFKGDSLPAIMHAHLYPPPLPEHWPEGTPPGFGPLLLRTWDPDPARRPATAGDVAVALRALPLDPLADDYAALEQAAAAGQWEMALALAQALRERDPAYRDAAVLEAQAADHLTAARRTVQAAEWQAAFDEALAGGALATAEAALVRWADLQPEAAAQAEPRLAQAQARALAGAALRTAPGAAGAAPEPPPVTMQPGCSITWRRAATLLLAVAGLVALVWLGGQARGLPAAATTATAVARQVATVEPTATASQIPTPTPTATRTPTPTRTSTPTRTPTATPRPAAGTVQTVTLPGGGSVEMVLVPAGPFTMGSDDGDSDEQPIHTVTLDAFWIDRTEVTNAQFTAFVADTRYETTAEQAGSGLVYTDTGWEQVNGADWQHPAGPASDLVGITTHPVVQVSWEDAAAFCAWRGARLPTEAEWEKAARGADGRTYPWGDAFDGRRLNYCDTNCPFDGKDTGIDDGYRDTAPAGSYPDGASPYGALDMAGNVWEWVVDWYSDDYYAQSPAENPGGPAGGNSRVLRGGAGGDNAYDVRASYRYNASPSSASYGIGFRCAQE